MIMAFLFLSPVEPIQYEARFWLQHMIVHHSEKLQHEEQELANLPVDRLKDKIKNSHHHHHQLIQQTTTQGQSNAKTNSNKTTFLLFIISQ